MGEEQIVARLARRDQAALTQLVAAYDADMVRLCFMVCGDHDIARDATQNAWYRVWSKPPELRDETRMRSWLLSVAANEARQIMRRRGIGRVREISAANPPLSFDAGRSDSRIDLAAVLRGLEPDDRLLLGLRYGLDMNSTQIATHLGISPEGVRTRLHRLLARVRKDLGHE
jgi:RNA polymerase sigma-70 factor, ECF subfamily